MRTVFATQFHVVPREGQAMSAAVEAVLERVKDWVTGRYQQEGRPFVLELDGKSREPSPGHVITGSVDSAASGVLLTIAWSYPHDDPTILWSVQTVIGARDGFIELAITVRIDSRGFVVRPVTYDLGRPRLVASLLRDFHCYAGSSRLRADPLVIAGESVPDFVDGPTAAGR